MTVWRTAAALAVSLGVATGSWSASAQPNPDPRTTDSYRRRGCGDPWVAIALEKTWGYVNALYCDVGYYNGGSWGSYADLERYVRAHKAQLDADRLRVLVVKERPELAVLVLSDQAVAKLATTMVAAGGGNMVAAGGGNMVAAGGGNMVAAGGGNIVTGLPPANLAALPEAKSAAYGLTAGKAVRVGRKIFRY